jgi:hypothetical protein
MIVCREQGWEMARNAAKNGIGEGLPLFWSLINTAASYNLLP